MITIYCSQCGEKYLADEQHIGGKFQCKNCHRILTIEKFQSSPTSQSVVQKDDQTPASQSRPRTIFPFGTWSSHRIDILLGLVILALLAIIFVLFGMGERNPLVQTPLRQKQPEVRSPIGPDLQIPEVYDIKPIDVEPFRPFKPIPIPFVKYLIPPAKNPTETNDEFQRRVNELITKNKEIDRQNANVEKESGNIGPT